MSTKKNGVTFTVVLLLAFAAMIAGFFVYQHLSMSKKIDRSDLHATVLDQPREISDFELTGIDNQSFTKTSLQGQWTMVFFGFTNCGSICPTTMAELGKMYHLLEQQSVQPLPRVVMISVDPERDSLQKLNAYVKAFDPHFYAARGEDADIKKLTQELGIAYIKVALPDSASKDHYDMQHSGAVMLFNPQGELTAFFTMPHKADLLSKDYQCLVG